MVPGYWNTVYNASYSVVCGDECLALNQQGYEKLIQHNAVTVGLRKTDPT